MRLSVFIRFKDFKKYVLSAFLGLMLIGTVVAESQSTLSGRVEALFRDLFYDKPASTPAQTKEVTSQGSLIAAQKSGQALVIARIADRSIPQNFATKLVQQFLAKATNPGIKFVTIEDLTGTAKEALQSKTGDGGMLEFSSNQQALQFAASRDPRILQFSCFSAFSLSRALLFVLFVSSGWLLLRRRNQWMRT